MFTGLVETLGRIETIHDEDAGKRLAIRWDGLNDPLTIGESIAVNGCCLTVVAIDGDRFEAQAGPETLIRTNLGDLRVGSPVNLERSLRVGDRLGGHFVQGHIDDTAELAERRPEGEWDFLRFRIDPSWMPMLVEKGSIAVDGVSLTVVQTGPDWFSVMLIPHTLAATTLGIRRIGDRVNVEIDVLAKHVRKLLEGSIPQPIREPAAAV